MRTHTRAHTHIHTHTHTIAHIHVNMSDSVCAHPCIRVHTVHVVHAWFILLLACVYGCVCVCVCVCTGDTNSGGVDNGSLSQDAGTDFVRHIPAEDTVSLCGVGGEVDVLNEIRQRRPIPRSPHAGSGAVHSALPETVTSIPSML